MLTTTEFTYGGRRNEDDYTSSCRVLETDFAMTGDDYVAGIHATHAYTVKGSVTTVHKPHKLVLLWMWDKGASEAILPPVQGKTLKAVLAKAQKAWNDYNK